MNAVYKAIGISRQGVIQYEQRQNIFDEKVRVLMLEAQQLRLEHPGCGVEKMYYALKPQFLGRDRFIELFMGLGFRLEHKKILPADHFFCSDQLSQPYQRNGSQCPEYHLAVRYYLYLC